MRDISAIAEKLGKIIPRLGSDHDGEVVATVAAIRRTLSSQGLDLHDLTKALVEPQPAQSRSYRPDPPPWDEPPKRERQRRPKWEEDVRWCLTRDNREHLSAREMDFLESMLDWEEPTQAQFDWIERIKAKIERKNKRGDDYWDWGQ